MRYHTREIFDNAVKIHISSCGNGTIHVKFEGVYTLNESYTATVNQHFNSRQFSPLEPTLDPFVEDLSRKLCEINMFVRGKYGPMCCLVDVLGASAMLEIRPSIPEDIMIVMTDQTVVPHVRPWCSIYVLHR